MRSFSQIPAAALEGLRRLGETAFGLLYPPLCTACGTGVAPGEPLCASCQKRLRPLRAPFCQRCSEPFSGALSGAFLCAHCRERRAPFLNAVAPYRAGGPVSQVIYRFKYHGQLSTRHLLADWLASALADPRLQIPPPELLVPVPLHPARRRERGFNQAEVLAVGLAARTGLAVAESLARIRYTTTQTALGRGARMENLRGAFRLRQAAEVKGRHLLLIDDVFTTGSTVEECARVLRHAGAATVRVLTVARAVSPL